jgi:hypothetical protein
MVAAIVAVPDMLDGSGKLGHQPPKSACAAAGHAVCP